MSLTTLGTDVESLVVTDQVLYLPLSDQWMIVSLNPSERHLLLYRVMDWVSAKDMPMTTILSEFIV